MKKLNFFSIAAVILIMSLLSCNSGKKDNDRQDSIYNSDTVTSPIMNDTANRIGTDSLGKSNAPQIMP